MTSCAPVEFFIGAIGTLTVFTQLLHGVIDSRFTCPPSVAHVEHHVAHNHLDKVGQAVKGGIEPVAFPIHMYFRIPIKDLQHSCWHNWVHYRIMLFIPKLDLMPNAKIPLSHRVHIDFFAISLVNLS